jgi:hypothetical protein
MMTETGLWLTDSTAAAVPCNRSVRLVADTLLGAAEIRRHARACPTEEHEAEGNREGRWRGNGLR